MPKLAMRGQDGYSLIAKVRDIEERQTYKAVALTSMFESRTARLSAGNSRLCRNRTS